jgi:hypothetical protein
MKTGGFRIAMALAVALCLMAVAAPVSPAHAATICVPCDHPTIQQAVNAANPGDTISVRAGIYNENVTVDRWLILRGENAGISAGSNPGTRDAESIINGQITIQVSDVRVNGFRVNSVGAAGIYVNGGTNDHTFSNNIFHGPGPGAGRGIELGGNTNGIVVSNNEFTNWLSGIYVNPSGNNALSVRGNNFHGNSVGIGSDGLNNVSVEYNDFTSNGEGWGYSDDGDVGGSNLEAHGNNFVDNATAIANHTWDDATKDLIDATGNWWGHPSGPFDDSTGPPQYNPTGQGDPVTDWVEYDPFLTEESGGASGGGCFIATAAYGSYVDSHVDTLRAFRDGRLESNSVGSSFVSAYYRLSPPVAEFIDDHPALKPAVRAGLLPAVGLSATAVGLTLAHKLAIACTVVLASALAALRLRRKLIPLNR